MIKLFVALGNPGKEYENTKHNIGWMVVDQLNLGPDSWKNKFKGEFKFAKFAQSEYYFLKPQTFMNLSGQSVQPFCTFYKITASEILVLHDELDLPIGEVQFKNGGGLAGHNGLKSIAQLLGTQDFYRLRIGIGRPTVGSVSDYVLSKFHGDDDIAKDLVVRKCGEALECFAREGFKVASLNYNKKKLF